MSHHRKNELSKALQQMCKESIYPPSCEMLKARCQSEFADINWSENGLENFIKNRLELFYGSGRSILDSIEQICQCSFPHDIINLILEMRGKDLVVIEHRKYPRIVSHLQNLCRDAGYDVIVRGVKPNLGKALTTQFSEDEKLQDNPLWAHLVDFLSELNSRRMTTQSLIQLRVGYQLEDDVLKPIYIGMADKNNPIDAKRAWMTLTGQLPSNVLAVQNTFYKIEKELDRIYQEIGDLHVRLCAPVNKQEQKYFNTVMECVDSNKTIPEPGYQTNNSSRFSLSKGLVIKLASAIRDTDGFKIDPVEPVKALSGRVQLQLAESKSNHKDEKPFSLDIGIGNGLQDKRLAKVWPVVFPRDSWILVLDHCKHEIAWNIWEKERAKKEQKENVKRKGGLSIRALQMAHKSKKQHEKNKDEVKTS